MFFVYILKSQTSSNFYKGYTSDPMVRLYEHNAGFSRHTKGKGPWTMVFLQEFKSKSDALKQEIRIKKLNNRSIEALISSSVNVVNDFWKTERVG